MTKNEENRLKTLLLILNESDLLDQKSILNLFSRFPVIGNEGVENLIVYVDILKTIDDAGKLSLISALKRQIESTVSEKSFPEEKIKVVENYETPVDHKFFSEPKTTENETGNLSVLFVLGLGGRDELKRILSDFIDSCRAGESIPSEMTSEYISSRLKLPPEPDLIISHSKHALTDFMIWQTAYSEYYFFEKDVSRLTDVDFKKAFDNFYKRERRYGA
ncbi:Ditrans,polycis-undecaprenyl-diphosphate synthase ((2E,6E)-farnesyl-diphosphate specific) [Methanimicrococcus hongohii]|uniref:Ditrans,polycis-undecaprenyl-diphosphate synthase ((2E,6E)-farnesyl-diphosphate specific) n=1 Tax=Methanimicrococcus hongohii TaxID=3028295 RepID=A0AA96V2A3_9EURY|nr:undecaprenyl diphosphate synthase family protein [Methanimicrococcus sp. Hf6]WNY23763.1 Ditrans,polycis-undecaprenyl-diphosphate synthase ((2E,6E)-farnesyl-diphosphate specific) [Methanimicrococcus sp. Hf6]